MFARLNYSSVEKQALRTRLLAERRELSSRIAEVSADICSAIGNLDCWHGARHVMIFLPISRNAEVDVTRLAAAYPDKKFSIPVITGPTSLNPAWYDPLSLKPAKWGVLEPEAPVFCGNDKPELIICPALAVDVSGIRLGYGKGYYDRFLAGNAAISVCVVPDGFLFERLPSDRFDIPVNFVVTDHNVLRTAPNNFTTG